MNYYSSQPPLIFRKNLLNDWLIKAALYCSAWHWVLLNVHHLLAFWIRSQSSLHWRSTFRKKLMVQKCKGCFKLESWKFVNHHFMYSFLKVKKFEFWRAPFGKTFFYICPPWKFHESSVRAWVVKKWILESPFGANPHCGTPNFCYV